MSLAMRKELLCYLPTLVGKKSEIIIDQDSLYCETAAKLATKEELLRNEKAH